MYLQLSKYMFSQQFQYRESLIFRFIGSFLWVYVQLCVWRALLGFQTDGRTFEEMAVYVLAAQIITFMTQSDVAMNLAEKIRTGAISTDLLRPVSMKWYLFWEQFSTNLFEVLFMGVPTILAGLFLWKMKHLELLNVILFLVCLCLAVMLTFYLQYTVGLLAFWFKDGTYARMLISGLLTIFSGKEIPLWFYPAALYSVSMALPFRFMVYEPVSVLLGEYDPEGALRILMLQGLWLFLMWLLERFIWHMVQNRIEVQGG